MISSHRSPVGLVLLFATCACNIGATAPQDGGWHRLFTDKVIACGAAAVALLVLSLLLRGLLKMLTLALVVVLAAGAFWFVREAWGHRSELLPRQWTVVADKTLSRPKARAEWRSLQFELSLLSPDVRNGLAAGTDGARETLIEEIHLRAQELRKDGNKSESDELERLARLIREQK